MRRATEGGLAAVRSYSDIGSHFRYWQNYRLFTFWARPVIERSRPAHHFAATTDFASRLQRVA